MGMYTLFRVDDDNELQYKSDNKDKTAIRFSRFYTAVVPNFIRIPLPVSFSSLFLLEVITEISVKSRHNDRIENENNNDNSNSNRNEYETEWVPKKQQQQQQQSCVKNATR